MPLSLHQSHQPLAPCFFSCFAHVVTIKLGTIYSQVNTWPSLHVRRVTARWCFYLCVCPLCYILCPFFSVGMMMIRFLVGIRRDMPGRPSQLGPQRISNDSAINRPYNLHTLPLFLSEQFQILTTGGTVCFWPPFRCGQGVVNSADVQMSVGLGYRNTHG